MPWPKIKFIGGPIAFMTFGVLFYPSAPITFESRESKTFDQSPVFNRIQKFTEGSQDIWMMQQSHHGLNAKGMDWDRLKIVVDKSTHPYQAKFYQLAPGPLSLKATHLEIAPKVSCVICHNNGPRAIRPNLNSISAVTLIDRLRVSLWNLKIKSYPRILALDTPLNLINPPLGKLAEEKLRLKSCTLCHQDAGLIGRGFLTRKNTLAIRFMVENGQMPPFPFAFPETDQKALHAFLVGL